MPTLILAGRPCGAAKPGYLRAHRCQLPPGREQADRIRARAAPASAGGPTPDVDDADIRATGPAPGPRPCASARSAREDRACHAARTARSWPPRAGRGSDSPGSTPPHARCHSYGTGRRRLSLGSRPRKWPACAGNEKLRTFSTATTCRCCSCQGPEQHPNTTPAPRPKTGQAVTTWPAPGSRSGHPADRLTVGVRLLRRAGVPLFCWRSRARPRHKLGHEGERWPERPRLGCMGGHRAAL
jgi:hypothetical protein